MGRELNVLYKETKRLIEGGVWGYMKICHK